MVVEGGVWWGYHLHHQKAHLRPTKSTYTKFQLHTPILGDDMRETDSKNKENWEKITFFGLWVNAMKLMSETPENHIQGQFWICISNLNFLAEWGGGREERYAKNKIKKWGKLAK